MNNTSFITFYKRFPIRDIPFIIKRAPSCWCYFQNIIHLAMKRGEEIYGENEKRFIPEVFRRDRVSW